MDDGSQLVTDGERERVMAEARRNIADKAELEHDLAARLLRAPLPDALTQWRAKAAERDAKWAEERTRRREAEAEHIRQQQEAAEPMAAFSESQMKILGAVIAELRKQLRAEMQTAVGELRAEVAVARSINRGEILDLPALPLRRRSDAA